jgi:hypothetical protein
VQRTSHPSRACCPPLFSALLEHCVKWDDDLCCICCLQHDVISFMCESRDLTPVWHRRECVRGPKRVGQSAPVRRSSRQCSRITRLGVSEHTLEMEGEEESATTKSSFGYSPGEL